MKTKTTRTSRYLVGILLLILAICSTGFAITLFDTGATSLVSGDPTQTLRLSRNNIPSDWSQNKAFPGTAGSGTYHYHTYTIPASAFVTTPFVQITNDDPTASVFVSTYLNSYNPASFSTNYLGDAGFNGGFAVLSETGFFQVQVPAFNDLVVVVNETATLNSGVGKPYRILVEGFTDTLYSNPSTPTPTPTPKPSPPAISIAVTPATIKEGNNATFTFSASPVSHAAITVNFQMSGQTTNGTDYTLTAANSIPMGTNQATATVTLKSKVISANDGSKTAIMTVKSGTGYSVGSPSSATVLIKDNK
jgi:hypothetical protein